jgi:hypothetical protein
LAVPLEQAQRGRGDGDSIRFNQQRLERQDLAVEGPRRNLAPKLGSHRLIASPGAFGRTREDKWAHRTRGEGNEIGQLPRQQHGDGATGHAGHREGQLSGIVRHVEEDEERRVVGDGAPDDTEGSVVAVVAQQKKRFADRAFALIAAHVDRRGRRVDLVEQAPENIGACRGRNEDVPERGCERRCRRCARSRSRTRGRAAVGRLGRRGDDSEPRSAARVALDEILDGGVEPGSQDRAGRVLRHLGHDRFQIRTAACGQDLVGPGDTDGAHVTELEYGGADECHDLGRSAYDDGSGARAQHPRGTRRAGCGHDARRNAAAGADERIRDTDGSVRVGNEHDRLDLVGLGSRAVENAGEGADRRVPIRGHDVHGVLAARDTGSFRRFVFHLTPAM